jgi:hypothetical protein
VLPARINTEGTRIKIGPGGLIIYHFFVLVWNDFLDEFSPVLHGYALKSDNFNFRLIPSDQVPDKNKKMLLDWFS